MYTTSYINNNFRRWSIFSKQFFLELTLTVHCTMYAQPGMSSKKKTEYRYQCLYNLISAIFNYVEDGQYSAFSLDLQM
jgi:hypothetical protein